MKIVIPKHGKIRSSYVNVFSPKKNDLSGNEEYSLMLLIPKSDKETIDSLKAAIKDAVGRKWGDKRPPNNLRFPLRDGDEEKDGVEPYTGCYFMNVKSKDKPGIVDRNLQPVIEPSEFQSGDYCRVSINSFAYDRSGNRGISFGLNNIQVLAKGEPLGGKSRPEDDFSSWDDGNSEEDSPWG